MIKQENDTLIRVNRKQAKRVYNEGKPVYLLPCKMRLENPWFNPCRVQKEEINTISNDGFNTIIARNREFETIENCFIYYNCNPETGKYAAWYIEK